MSNQEEWFDIFQAAQELQLSKEYIRLLVRQGVIVTKQVPIKEGSAVLKHVIAKSELIAFASRENAKAPRRTDGRGKHCFYATEEETLRIKEILYATHDEGLMIVAATLQTKEGPNGHYVPPSKQINKETNDVTS